MTYKTKPVSPENLRHFNQFNLQSVQKEREAKRSSMWFKISDGGKTNQPGDLLAGAERILQEANGYKRIKTDGKLDVRDRIANLNAVRQELNGLLPDIFSVERVGKGDETRLVLRDTEDNRIIYDPGVNGNRSIHPKYQLYETTPSHQFSD